MILLLVDIGTSIEHRDSRGVRYSTLRASQRVDLLTAVRTTTDRRTRNADDFINHNAQIIIDLIIRVDDLAELEATL